MRILQLDAGREMRGGQWQVLRLMEGLSAAGVEATLLAPARSPLYAKASARGLDVQPWRLAALRRLSRRADLTHAHDARSHTWAALLSATPVVVARRVAFPIRSRWKYAKAARYIAVSEFVKQVLVAGGVPDERISVVYDGVPLAPPPARMGDRIVAPATADPRKGSDLAREAARLSGVPVEFSSDLGRDLPGARLLVYLTRSEGLGSGVLLAMATGVAVLASHVGGLPEIIVHGENGWLTRNEPVAIAAALRALAADEALARHLAIGGRRTVAERFPVEVMVRGTIQVYRQVLAC